MKKILKTKRGFTLIELLVVIGIIGILATIGAVSFGSARGKARDAKRQGDLRSLQSGIEVYGADQNYYPIPTASSWTDLLTKVQMSSITPPGTSLYCYYANSATTPTSYTLVATGFESSTFTNTATTNAVLMAQGGTGTCSNACATTSNLCLTNSK